MSSLGELNLDRNIEDKKENLKKYERSRHFIVWHDASVIANHGHILFNVHVMYDPAVFYTSDEYSETQDMMLMCKERLKPLNFT